MFAWYSSVADIELKPKTIAISDEQLLAWFFDNGIEQDPNSMRNRNWRVEHKYDFDSWSIDEVEKLCTGYWTFVKKILEKPITEKDMLNILESILRQ